jgi:hypothetical protein
MNLRSNRKKSVSELHVEKSLMGKQFRQSKNYALKIAKILSLMTKQISKQSSKMNRMEMLLMIQTKLMMQIRKKTLKLMNAKKIVTKLNMILKKIQIVNALEKTVLILMKTKVKIKM